MRQLIALFTIAAFFASCNVLTTESKQKADYYAINQVYPDMNIMYQTTDGLKVIESNKYFDFTEEDSYYLRIDIDPVSDPELRIRNNSDQDRMLNGSIYSKQSDRPLSSVGGMLYAESGWKILKGQFTR